MNQFKIFYKLLHPRLIKKGSSEIWSDNCMASKVAIERSPVSSGPYGHPFFIPHDASRSTAAGGGKAPQSGVVTAVVTEGNLRYPLSIIDVPEGGKERRTCISSKTLSNTCTSYQGYNYHSKFRMNLKKAP